MENVQKFRLEHNDYLRLESCAARAGFSLALASGQRLSEDRGGGREAFGTDSGPFFSGHDQFVAILLYFDFNCIENQFQHFSNVLSFHFGNKSFSHQFPLDNTQR